MVDTFRYTVVTVGRFDHSIGYTVHMHRYQQAWAVYAMAVPTSMTPQRLHHQTAGTLGFQLHYTTIQTPAEAIIKCRKREADERLT